MKLVTVHLSLMKERKKPRKKKNWNKMTEKDFIERKLNLSFNHLKLFKKIRDQGGSQTLITKKIILTARKNHNQVNYVDFQLFDRFL